MDIRSRPSPPQEQRTIARKVARPDSSAVTTSSVDHTLLSLPSLPVSGIFRTTPDHASYNIPPCDQSMPCRKAVTPPQEQCSAIALQKSSKVATAPTDLARYSATASNTGVKHSLSSDNEGVSKRPKPLHDAGQASLLEQQPIFARAHGYQLTPSPNPTGCAPGQTYAGTLSSSSPSLHGLQCSNSSEEREDVNDPQDDKEIKRLAVDPDVEPQGPLGIEIMNKAKGMSPIATKTGYEKAKDNWLTPEELEDYRQTIIIKPEPAGGDVGVPEIADAPAVDGWAMRCFNAMIDNDYFWGSVKSPVAQLIYGKTDRRWIIHRSYDLVKEVVKYHTEGLETSIWANSENLRASATSLSDIKTNNEQNDCFIVRMSNILCALQYHKGMVMDVLAAEKSLAYSIILAPKARLLKKFAYKSSNHHRGEQTKVIKAKAAKWNEKHDAAR